MSADLMPFDYEGQTVRTVVIDGEPWFIGGDVARALGYVNPSDALARLDADDRRYATLALSEGSREVSRPRTVVNEAGVYQLVFGSSLPDAARFRRWITHDVLPAIRRTGSYGTPALPDITTAEGVLVMAEQFAATARQLVATQAKVAELEPKADLADSYLNADSADRLVGQAAKLLRQKEKDLRRFLIEERLVFVRHSKCGAIQYEPYADYAEHFAVHETVVNHTWGSCSHFTLRIRPRGIDLIRKRLTRTQLQPA